MEWKYKIGTIIPTGRRSSIIVTGRKEEECSSGTQRFYGVYHVLESLASGLGATTQILWLPDLVVEEMGRLSQEAT